ncbi:FKBP-type peptidyl-prolyl cis-trans isomerase [Haladaptatus sp. F3-133]|jgi:FKBP-type peptidyl-prolyl cis-trans isomerase 2|uniref:Peptidyl-prolyl cis-trans isomerase n=1 Tax=Halorutilus salinus TaxID=2487751 RepID=A0A9Q4C660_9EURY|nr:FKBP-type peptidyl-prolyl cis-trans isomerase [Halorutilus salinus]MCX2819880.1 FKBP-type peptidyl-prolyl cis-trans isomerase [Halorutilus salinus]
MAVNEGNTVSVEYVGRHEDGDVFDSSREDVAVEAEIAHPNREYEPLEFEVGAGEVVRGFDEAVVGMEEGEEKEITVPPEKGYGERSEENVVEYDREEFGESLGEEPEVGMHIHTEEAHGDIVEVEDDSVTVDFNHELAGETLVFEIEVVEVA